MSTAMQGNIFYAAEAGEDLSAALFTFATIHSDGKIYQANSGEAVLGVITEAAASGAAVSVQVDGIAKILLSGSLNAGDRVMSDNAGKAAAAINSPAGNAVAGMLLSGGSSDEVATIALHVGGGA